MKLTELWHYPRPELAQAYLAALDTGLLTSATIFAPRRTGKTAFLRRDLGPYAESQGYTVVYADLWQTRQTPGAALIRSLEEALEPHTLLERVKARIVPSLRTITASAEFAGAKLEGDLAFGDTKRAAIADKALLIDALLAELVQRKPVLLLIDEAQSLGQSEEGEDVARALRTALTKHQKRLRAVFTGSSRTQLGHVFTDANAPLYSAASPIRDFPLLDEAFVLYVAERYQASTTRSLDLAQARTAFASFRQRPEPLLELVVSLMMNPDLSFEAAWQDQQDRLARLENHDGVWAGLNAIDRALLRLIARNPALKPFSRAVTQSVGHDLGTEDPSTAHVQKALLRLAERGIAAKTPRGVYEFEDENFGAWVRQLADAAEGTGSD